MKLFSVKARKGNDVVTLRSGFTSRDAAEDHPVTMAHWDEVWVCETEAPAPARETLPERPWNIETASHPTANGSFHTYIVDANGRKIAAIWGRGTEKRITAQTIVDAVNAWGRAAEQEELL